MSFIKLTLVGGAKFNAKDVDAYRLPDERLGDNPKASLMVHAAGQWIAVLDTEEELEKMLNK